MAGSGAEGQLMHVDENISRTFCEPCGYVVAGAGGGARFCDRPAAPRSSYCAAHGALCRVPPGSAAAAKIVRGFARAARRPAPPPPGIAELPLAEPAEPTEPHEVMAALALAPPLGGGDAT